MTDVVTLPDDHAASLPALVDRAAAALASARTAAEILDAKAMAAVAYDTAKSTARFLKAKGAFDELLPQAYRVQADALELECRAKRRIADEYDEAKKRGEVKGHGGARNFKTATGGLEMPSLEEMGLTTQQLDDWRKLRDFEAADPGITRRIVDEKLAEGVPPTKAALRRVYAEEKLRQTIDNHHKTVEAARKANAAFQQPVATPEQKAIWAEQFGTQEDRAIHARIKEIIARITEQPSPAEAVRRIPPASRRSVDVAEIDNVIEWLIAFNELWEE